MRVESLIEVHCDTQSTLMCIAAMTAKEITGSICIEMALLMLHRTDLHPLSFPSLRNHDIHKSRTRGTKVRSVASSRYQPGNRTTSNHDAQTMIPVDVMVERMEPCSLEQALSVPFLFGEDGVNVESHNETSRQCAPLSF